MVQKREKLHFARRKEREEKKARTHGDMRSKNCSAQCATVSRMSLFAACHTAKC